MMRLLAAIQDGSNYLFTGKFRNKSNEAIDDKLSRDIFPFPIAARNIKKLFRHPPNTKVDLIPFNSFIHSRCTMQSRYIYQRVQHVQQEHFCQIVHYFHSTLLSSISVQPQCNALRITNSLYNKMDTDSVSYLSFIIYAYYCMFFSLYRVQSFYLRKYVHFV